MTIGKKIQDLRLKHGLSQKGTRKKYSLNTDETKLLKSYRELNNTDKKFF